jgi:tripartite-type tricarboxylate transporter receptor subunit TctC
VGAIKSAVAAALLVAGIAGPGCKPSFAAEGYPATTITIVVPFPAGGTADILPRLVADLLRAKWGQSVIIENRPGAGGNIGAEYVARAKPDGYTLLASPPGPLAINQILYKQLAYDATKFVPITILGTVPNVLIVSPKVEARSVQMLIEQAKKNPGKITFASQGVGSTSHLTGHLFEMKAGINLLHVPYKGTAPALNDLIGGHVDLMFDNLASSLAQHRAGTAKILAVASLTRTAVLTDVPTVAESGLPGFQSVTWFGLVAPANTPPAIVVELNQAVVETLRQPDVRERFLGIAVEPLGDTPAETVRFIKEENARWGEVINAANVKLD